MIYYTNHLSQSLLHIFVCLQIFWCPFLHLLSATTNTITSTQHLNVSGTISSDGGDFELGFFRPGNSSAYFVGIWFKKVSQPSIVWVANRDFPLHYSSPVLTFSPEGNLVIREEKITYAVTNISSTAVNATLTLLDSGNLVLRDGVSSAILWQSFDYPSDTFLPGMKLGYDKRNGKVWSLVSWKSLEDSGFGDFSMQLDPEGSTQLLIMQEKKIYWTSGSWNGSAFSFFSGEPFKKLDNISFVSNENQSYFTFSGYNSVNSPARIMLDVSGQIKQQTLSMKTSQWVSNWSEPADQCRVYAYCGSFGGCRRNSNRFCSCLSGFIPSDPKNWNLGDMSDGCLRKTPLSCNASESKEDGFRPISPVVLPVNPTFTSTGNAVVCRSRCLTNCSCSAYTYDTTNGCQTWGSDLFNLQLLSDGDTDGKSLFIKLAASEIEEKGSKWQWWVWLLLSFLVILLLIFAVGLFIFLRGRRNYQKIVGEDLLQFDIDNCHWSTNSGESSTHGKDEKKEVQLPLFSFSSVSTATGNFSNENKLGEGGFGPVYKGGLQKGYEVAVKRLSKKSGQGWEELKNEATLIAKLQHKNLVRILGCCLEQDENILIYEYLPNRSLDFFLFDPLRRQMLYWKTRNNIIMGIAQGLLYLHEYSRLRIIHRDLKASNILLDKGMNPKISDFGLARIFGEDKALATNRIVGTYGYMSPEYAMDGRFSVKSDVFSFGILLLEILSGRRNSGLFTKEVPNLLGYAWDLWKKGKSVQVIDPVLEDMPPAVQSRYVIIALLCVQECAEDRPTMFEVSSMLSNETVIIATPKLPKSSIMRSVMDGDSSMTTVSRRFSMNDQT